jgi:2-haloacid dehalogenase
MTDVDLTMFKALSFDCYGTLIDWEAGIAAVLGPWAREQGLDVTDEELLLAYADNEAAVERETPTALYPAVLASAFRRTGEALGHPVRDEWAQRLGDSVPDWPAFPDSADALARLAKHYQLIILSMSSTRPSTTHSLRLEEQNVLRAPPDPRYLTITARPERGTA